MIACELGYRILPSETLSLDLAVFCNEYDGIILGAVEQAEMSFAAAPVPHMVLPNVFGNYGDATSYGGEASVAWQPHERWRLRAFYGLVAIDLDVGSSGASDGDDGNAPRHQVGVRLSLDVTRDLRFDTNLRWVGELESPGIDAYVEADARLAWTPRDGLELALVGQNLFDRQHPEFSTTTVAVPDHEIERSVYASLTWDF